MSRPTSQLSNYRGPIQGLYLGGSGAHPGTVETGGGRVFVSVGQGTDGGETGFTFHSELVGVILILVYCWNNHCCWGIISWVYPLILNVMNYLKCNEKKVNYQVTQNYISLHQ